MGSREHHTQSHDSERLRSEIQRDEALIHHAEDLMQQSEMHRAERVGVQQQQRVGEEVCGTKTFTVVEDRPVIRERVERIVEHRPVEKQVCSFSGVRGRGGGTRRGRRSQWLRTGLWSVRGLRGLWSTGQWSSR